MHKAGKETFRGGDQEPWIYYITLHNENHAMPAIAEDRERVEKGVVDGMYLLQRGEGEGPRIQLFGSGSILQQVLQAQALLSERGIAADIWSVTSYNELYRDAINVERWNRLHPLEQPRKSYLQQTLADQTGVFIAVSDYMKALPNSIASWMPGPYSVLGTDGFGLSESRSDLRDYFEISPEHIAVSALHQLAQCGKLELQKVQEAIRAFAIDADKINPAEQ